MLIGLHLYDGDDASANRQRAAVDALLRLRGVEAVNLQFQQGPQATHGGIQTAAVLERDSVSATGIAGRSRPLTGEMFDVLADLARARGHEYFGFINGDIVVTPGVLHAVSRTGRQTYAISRRDVDETGGVGEGSLVTAGQDMFVVACRWWSLHRMRFRQYIVGEACWDNVYTAIMMCHSDGEILNREPLILHPKHERLWGEATPAARYNGMLAALDARYFSMWSRYWHRLELARSGSGPASDEDALRREAFVWRRSAIATMRQGLRSALAQYRYQRFRAEWTPMALEQG